MMEQSTWIEETFMTRFKLNFVMFLTLSRVIGIPFLLIINDKLILFICAFTLFVTDFLDGYFARRWKVATISGAVMDLLADKLLVIVLLLVGVLEYNVPIIIFILITFREVMSMYIRIKKLLNKEKLIEASFIGKSKTALQFFALTMMILEVPGYNVILVFVVFLSYYSFIGYLKIFFKKDSL